MNDADDRLRAEIAGSLRAGGLAVPGSHPDAERLLAYRAGELPEAEAEELRDHLETCRPCLEDLLDLGAFVAAGQEGPPTARDLGAAAFWRSLRARVPGRSRRTVPFALAAALLAAAVGLGLWGFQQRLLVDELQGQAGPQPDARVVDLFPESSERGGGAAEPLDLAEMGGFLTLILNLPQEVNAEAFEVALEDPQGRRIWSGRLQRTPFGTLQLGLPRGLLGAGTYHLQADAVVDGGRRRVGSFPLTFTGEGRRE